MNNSTSLTLLLKGRTWLFEELASGNFTGERSAFERSVLNFCHAWLSDKNSFTLTTSGSTGAPREITLSRSSMEASARGTGSAIGLRSGFTALLCLDPRYIAGQMMLVRSFVTGMNIVAVEPTANPFALVSHRWKIDFTAMVPYQLQAVLSSPADRLKLNSLKSVLIGGAELSAKTRSELKAGLPDFYETYGMTETISHIALRKSNPPDAHEYFQLLPGIQIEQDVRGCLVIAAAFLGHEKIVTNDLVEILADNRFKWLGRFDSIINTGGVKIIPEELEKEIGKTFLRLGIANRFFIYGLPDVSLGSKVVLFVEGNFGDEDILMATLKKVLDKYEIPRELKTVDRFIETDTQKINRKATAALMK